MAIPLVRVKAPRWTVPVFALWRQSFEVIIEGALSPDAELMLSRDGETALLKTGNGAECGKNLVSLVCIVPDCLPEQLYDLILVDDGHRYICRKAGRIRC